MHRGGGAEEREVSQDEEAFFFGSNDLYFLGSNILKRCAGT